jgi:hypothetical protein
VDLAKLYYPKAKVHAEKSEGLFNMPAGAEFDDLVQVGLERVVIVLGKGLYPTKAIITNSMKNHLRDIFHLQAGGHV